MSDYDEGYQAGMQKMREVGQGRIEELEAELEYWKKDSADAWDKCEENRVKLVKMEKKMEEWW